MNRHGRISTHKQVGADGRNSAVRKTIDAEIVEWQYNQLGVVATVGLQQPGLSGTAWQRFLPTGPIALLPVIFHFNLMKKAPRKCRIDGLVGTSERGYQIAATFAETIL
jgi:2-polyprenyl-6-methoxyphenol hydroxylase-like FAD-dependent oxidoreductase